MLHRILAVTAALAVLPALLAAVSPPSGDASSSSVTVATGTITSPSGAAMPGVTVDLYAWPSDAVLSAIMPGQQVPTTLLTTTTASATGTYSLQVAETSLKAVAVDTGYANLEIQTAVGFWFFPYQTDPPPGQSPGPVTVNLGQSKWACGYDSRGRPYGFSGFRLERPRAPAWAVVGQGYIVKQQHTKGDWLKYLYGQGASHTQASALGVGISGYGFDAGYTSAGAHMSSATQAVLFGKWHANSWFETEFNTGQYRGVCYGLPYQKVPHLRQHGRCPKRFHSSYVHKCIWMIHSRGWFGGSNVLHPKTTPRTPSGNCAFTHFNTGFESDYGVAVRWSRGFALGAALDIKGVDLKAYFNSSAQTGYDTNGHMKFWFARSGYLCGTNGPESTAAQLVARSGKV